MVTVKKCRKIMQNYSDANTNCFGSVSKRLVLTRVNGIKKESDGIWYATEAKANEGVFWISVWQS